MQVAHERLQSHLETGERVLWVGSPSPQWFSPRVLLEIVGPALLISLILGGGLFLLLFVSGDLDDAFGEVLSMSTFS